MASEAPPHPGLHVEPTASGRWVVRYAHRNHPLSDHLTASEAQRCAQRRARAEGIAVVLLRDSYARVHEVPTAPEHPLVQTVV